MPVPAIGIIVWFIPGVSEALWEIWKLATTKNPPPVKAITPPGKGITSDKAEGIEMECLVKYI